MNYILQTKDNNCLATAYYNLAQWLGNPFDFDYLDQKVKYLTWGACDPDFTLLEEVCQDKCKILGSAFDLNYLEYGEFLKNPMNCMIVSRPIDARKFHTFLMVGSDSMSFDCVNSYTNNLLYPFNYVFYDSMLRARRYEDDLFYATDCILLTKSDKKPLSDLIQKVNIRQYNPNRNMRSFLVFKSHKMLGYTGSGSSYRIKDYYKFSKISVIYEVL